MVMAGTERTPGPATDASHSARLQWLRQRREALQEKIALKNSELKILCVDEAELTGVLPPEIPLEPGESPPTFRRRVDTCPAYPQNLINRLKTNEAEESTLELERQLQVSNAEDALRILNDPAQSKAVRRKQRSIYQQSQRRLRELEARLSFIRQAYGRVYRRSHVSTLEGTSLSTGDISQQSQTNAKHRTKKPRPPLDSLSTGSESSAKPGISSRNNILQETVGNANPPLGESHHQYHVYRHSAWSPQDYRSAAEDPAAWNLATDIRNYNHGFVSPTVDGLVDRRRNTAKYPEHDLNDNHDVYILPDRYRPRTYSQGNSDAISVSGQKYCQDTERTYRTIPNTYTEEERQIRYRQMQQKRHLDTYNSRHNLQPEVQQHSPQQHSPQHQKPPLHHNYQANSHLQHQHQQQLLDNRAGSINTQNYSQSEGFVRPAGRYGNLTEDSRLVPAPGKKNLGQISQRGADMRETMPGGRLAKTNLQQDIVRPDGQLPAGNWVRENDEIVWCPEESPPDRFGSLDRRKYGAQCAAYSAGMHTPPGQDERGGQQRYGSQQQQQQNNAPSRDYVLGLAGASKYPSSSAVNPHHQNYNSQVLQGTNSASCKRISPPPRTLLRTQSLGSVETWQQTSASPGLRGHEIQQQSQSMRRDDRGSDCAGRRGKEKEWYETSMDTTGGYSSRTPMSAGFEVDPLPPPPHREMPRQMVVAPSSPLHASARSVAMQSSAAPPPPPPPPPSPPSLNSKDGIAQRAGIAVDQTRQLPPPQQLRYNQNSTIQAAQRHPPSPKSLEIPAESKPSRRSVEEALRSDRSPDLCTIVQAGKYQPYREVTKPFEMSDFYKYSTKYRKRAEALTTQQIPGQRNVLQTAINGEEDDLASGRRRHDSASSGSCNLRDDDSPSHAVPNHPVQRKIYEPVQRMSCQPYGGERRRLAEENGGEWRATVNSRTSSEDSTVV